MKKLVAAFGALLGLVACQEDVPFGSVVHYSARDNMFEFFRTATARGPLLVHVQGSYPGFESELIADRILNAMEKGMTQRKFKATQDISVAHSPDYRVSWIVSPPENYNANRACRGDYPAPIDRGKPTFAIVFCVGDEVYRHMTGWLHSDVNAQSEQFDKFVGVVTRDLFK